MNHGQKEADLGEEASAPLDNETTMLLVGNQAAFKGFLRRRLPSDAAAEDLLQQSILKAIRSPESLAGKENITAWFYRILRNSLIDFYRSRAAEGRKNDAFLDSLITAGETSQSAPDEELLGEVCACLKRLLPTLKSEYGGLINRIDLNGELPATVAESLGITYNNLLVRLHRARQALRKSLEQSCGACAKHGCLDCTCGHGQGHASNSP
ncbi:MAG: sigma-70 family RNA polymerase sigma factor [Fibrobacteria bacterium]